MSPSLRAAAAADCGGGDQTGRGTAGVIGMDDEPVTRGRARHQRPADDSVLARVTEADLPRLARRAFELRLCEIAQLLDAALDELPGGEPDRKGFGMAGLHAEGNGLTRRQPSLATRRHLACGRQPDERKRRRERCAAPEAAR